MRRPGGERRECCDPKAGAFVLLATAVALSALAPDHTGSSPPGHMGSPCPPQMPTCHRGNSYLARWQMCSHMPPPLSLTRTPSSLVLASLNHDARDHCSGLHGNHSNRRLQAMERRRMKTIRQVERRRQKIFETIAEIGEEAWRERRSAAIEAKKQAREHMRNANMNLSSAVTILVDLSFCELHSHAEMCSLAKQIRCAYSYLLSSNDSQNVAFYLTSYRDSAKDALQVHSAENWAAERIGLDLSQWIVSESQRSTIKSEDIVYLSPDADVALESVDVGKIYIVAGIVDKTLKPGLSMSQAQNCGLQCARLPYADLFPQSVKGHVLNVDTVIQILSAYGKQRDWEKTFDEILPKYKKEPRHLRFVNRDAGPTSGPDGLR